MVLKNRNIERQPAYLQLNASLFILAGLNGIFQLFAIRGIFHYERSRRWLQGQRTISTRSSINSRIIDGSTPNYDHVNHIFLGFLYSARWLPNPIATAREPLIYHHMLDLFVLPRTVHPTVLLRVLNCKLSDRAPFDKIALAEGGTVLFETRSIDTVGGTTAFDLPRLAQPLSLTSQIPNKENRSEYSMS